MSGWLWLRTGGARAIQPNAASPARAPARNKDLVRSLIMFVPSLFDAAKTRSN
jgi:hypothetical protein